MSIDQETMTNLLHASPWVLEPQFKLDRETIEWAQKLGRLASKFDEDTLSHLGFSGYSPATIAEVGWSNYWLLRKFSLIRADGVRTMGGEALHRFVWGWGEWHPRSGHPAMADLRRALLPSKLTRKPDPQS